MPTPLAPQKCGISVTDEINKTTNYFDGYIYVITDTGNCLFINIKKASRAVADSEQYILLILIKGGFFLNCLNKCVYLIVNC